MKWKTGFVLVLVILAVVPLGVESVSGMASDWEYELWSDVTSLSVSDDGHVAAVVSTPTVSDIYLFDKEGNLLWDREFEGELGYSRGIGYYGTPYWFSISQDANCVIVCKYYYGPCYFLDKTGKIFAQYDAGPVLEERIKFPILGISPNGKCLAKATYCDFSYDEFEQYIVLNNNTGELLWACTIKYDEQLTGRGYDWHIMSVSDNGEVVVGFGNFVHFLKDGEKIWEYGIKKYEYFRDVEISPNGDYIVLSAHGVKGDSIHTLDNSGNLINKKSVDSVQDIFSVSSEGTYKVISEDKIEIYKLNNTLIEEQIVEIPDAVLSPNAMYAASASQEKIYFYNLSKVTNVFEQDITEELSNNTRDAILNVTTVKYDQDMILTVHGESVEDHSHSTVDYEAERSYTSGSISVTYVDGKNVYVRMGEGGWEKQGIDYQWSMEKKVAEFLGCEPPLYIKILRSEVVNGVDCWVVKSRPVEPVPNIELTATDWIAKKDYLPRKSQVRTRLTTDDLTTTRTIYFYDYNEPLDLPEPPTTPSFEVIFALAGLLTVAFILLKRRRA